MLHAALTLATWCALAAVVAFLVGRTARQDHGQRPHASRLETIPPEVADRIRAALRAEVERRFA